MAWQNYRIVPFDIEKAKAGAEVVTKKGKLKVDIFKYDLKVDRPILAVINFRDGSQSAHTYYPNGKLFTSDEHEYDLRIREEIKCRRMTNQELAWWLRDCPEEHREWSTKNADNLIYHIFDYVQHEANEECSEDILIRCNGGEWVEPLIEI